MCVCCDCRKMNRYSECVYYGCVYLCVCVGELQNSLVKPDSESGTTITLILWHCATRYPAYITSENNRRTFSICKMRFSAIYHGLPCIWMRHAVFHAFNCRSCNNKFYDSALHVENGGDCVLVYASSICSMLRRNNAYYTCTYLCICTETRRADNCRSEYPAMQLPHTHIPLQIALHEYPYFCVADIHVCLWKRIICDVWSSRSSLSLSRPHSRR